MCMGNCATTFSSRVIRNVLRSSSIFRHLTLNSPYCDSLCSHASVSESSNNLGSRLCFAAIRAIEPRTVMVERDRPPLGRPLLVSSPKYLDFVLKLRPLKYVKCLVYYLSCLQCVTPCFVFWKKVYYVCRFFLYFSFLSCSRGVLMICISYNF